MALMLIVMALSMLAVTHTVPAAEVAEVTEVPLQTYHSLFL